MKLELIQTGWPIVSVSLAKRQKHVLSNLAHEELPKFITKR